MRELKRRVDEGEMADGAAYQLLIERVEKVLALHSEDVWENELGPPHHTGRCGECDQVLPCPTRRLLDGEE